MSRKKERNKEVVIDASNKVFGRLASQVAFLLQGKDLSTYQPHLLCLRKVIVSNLRKVRFTGKKLEAKRYFRHTGYPGRLKTESLRDLFKRTPKELFKKTVFNMLPRNKLRKKMIKNLKIKV